MAELDVGILSPEIEQQEVDAGEALFNTSSQAPQSTTRGDILAGQTLVVTNREADPAEHVVARMEPDKESAFQQAIAQQKDEVLRQAQQILSATLETDPAAFVETAQATQQQLQELDQAAGSPVSNEAAVVQSVALNAPIPVDKKIKDEETFRLAALNDVAALLEKQGTIDNVLDIGGMFLPFNLTADLSDVLDKKWDFTNATDIEQFILDFQALPADRKLAEWPIIVESIMAATGTSIVGVEVSDSNTLKAAGILMNLLNPEGASSQSTERLLDILFGAADVSPAVVGVAGASLNHLRRSANMIKAAERLGDAGRAANMNMGAMTDDAVAASAGVTKQTAYTNALPINQGALRPEHTAGLAPEISKRLNDLQMRANGLRYSFEDESILIKEGLLRRSEKQRVIKDRIGKLESMGKEPDALNEAVHVDNIQVVKQDETGFTITYDMENRAAALSTQQIAARRRKVLVLERELENTAGRAAKKEIQANIDAVRAELAAAKTAKQSTAETYRWGIDDVSGNFIETTEHAIPGFEYGVSPAAWSYTGEAGDFLASSKSASNIADLSAASQAKILDMVKAADKPTSGVLGTAARKRIASVEIYGDEFLDPATGTRGKVFTVDELMAGVNTPNGTVRLTSPAELETYYGRRIVADQFWQIENSSARRRLEILGFKNEVKLNGEPAVARLFDDVDNAKASARAPENTGKYAFDQRTFESVQITDDVLDEAYNSGYILARTSDDTPVNMGDGVVEHFDFALVKADEVGPLPQQVIHYKPGYVPKINKGVEYLVKEAVPATKRGNPNFRTLKTHRFFASKADADRYTQQLRAEWMAKNPNASEAEAVRRFPEPVRDREQTPMQRLHEDAGSSGGMYTGARSSSDITTGLRGVKTERVSPFEAFQRNAQHLGSLVARNEWRLGEEQRWLRTIEHYGIENRGFNGTVLKGDNAVERALERQRTLIKQWSGVPTLEESAFQGIMQNLHDWALEGARSLPGLKNKDSIKSLLWLKHTDPAAAMKSAAFNLALGVLNPSQLFVQASAISVALSRFPRIAHTASGYAMKLALTDRMGDVATAQRIARLMDDADTPLFDEVRLAWERSGLRESVRQNADLNAADSYGVMSLNAFKRMSDANLVLYRAGELTNRRVSFVASYLNWKRNNPGMIPDNDALKSIKADANLSMLELNHANRAQWQGGPDAGTFRNILGVMTQFQQVGAKALELLIKGKARGGFTGIEKARILMAQTALYGAAGIPMANAISQSIVDWLGVEMSKEDQEALNQGLMGALVVNAFGAEVEIAPRLAPFGQTSQFIRDLVFDDVPFAEKAFGVFGDMGGRIGQAFARLQPMVMTGLAGREIEKDDYLRALTVLGQVPSSSRGLVKAWIMHNQHKIMDRHGNLVDAYNYNWQTEVGAALGFRPIRESETRITQMSNRDYSQLVTDYSDVVMDVYQHYLNSDSSRAGLHLSQELQVLEESIDNPVMWARIMRAVKNRIDNGTSLRDQEIREFFNRTIPNEIDAGVQVMREGFFRNLTQERAVVQPFEREE